LSIYHHR